MKIDKWISQTTYVDHHTGEIINKRQVEKEYIIKKKIKTIKYEQELNRKTKNIETIGIITWTNECTREGKQLPLIG